ncbi:response regulator, partial [uncultured Marinobacter sp.]|uniref:response regulator n=1 Tax=uncultured Marinobacter sp. TaxID=187379 RepID=UPI0030DCA3E9
MRHADPIHIFIADDDADDRLLIGDAFAEDQEPVRLSFFQDGNHLLSGLSEALSLNSLPDLILLDLNMPGKDGHEVIVELKSNPALRKLPIVVLTTSSDPRDIAVCYDTGASSYIVKPVTYEGLIDVARSLKNYWAETSTLPGKSHQHA